MKAIWLGMRPTVATAEMGVRRERLEAWGSLGDVDHRRRQVSGPAPFSAASKMGCVLVGNLHGSFHFRPCCYHKCPPRLGRDG